MWKAKFLLRRLAALTYDLILITAVLFVATALVLPLNGGRAFAAGQWAYAVYLAVVAFLFVGWFWTHGGQTLGMKAWRLRLSIAEEGLPIGWGRAAVRFGAAIVSGTCFGFGYWWIVFDPEGLAWHDRLSGTRVQSDQPQGTGIEDHRRTNGTD